VSWVVIAILVFWTVALFFGIGLFAESNSLVLSALAFGALSIAFAFRSLRSKRRSSSSTSSGAGDRFWQLSDQTRFMVKSVAASAQLRRTLSRFGMTAERSRRRRRSAASL
jgi:hypothetical protein